MKVHSIVIILCCVLAFSAEAQSVNQAALDSLTKACSRSNSDSYAVWVNGKSVVSWHRGKKDTPIHCHSVAKSIASLAIGKLFTDGQLSSIDTPVYAFYPEWKQVHRKEITIRHLLNHTSGLATDGDIQEDWDAQEDHVQMALCADLVSRPGSEFNYNNKAFILLMGVIGKASGMSTDKYIDKKLFRPLGIKNYVWEYDNAGNTIGLESTSSELIKIGQLVLNKGKWNGEQLISQAWITESMQAGQPYVKNCGLLWWIIPQHTLYIVDDIFLNDLKEAGIKEELIQKFELLKGIYQDVNIPEERLIAVFGTNWLNYLSTEFYPYYPGRSRREYSDEIIGYKAEGWLGQFIVIYPEKNLVAVRMISHSDNYDPYKHEMMDFEKYVYKLVP